MKIPWYLMAKGKGGGTKTASGPIAHWTDGVAAPLRSLLVNIDPVQSGSGDPSPDNVWPISGWSAVNVWRTGVNVWDEEWENGYFSFAGIPSASTTAIRSKNFCPCVGGLTYYYFFGGSAGTTYILWYDRSQTIIGTRIEVSNAAVTSPSNAAFFKVCTNASYGTTYDHDISINYLSIDHDYHPYSGNQYTIQLGDTYYGGTLDVTNGVLTVDRENIPSYNGETLPGEWISDRDVYAPGTTPTIGAQVVYTLATPITIPLTPQEISTLQGQSNVWADCGDVTVEYLSAGGANPDLMKLAVAFMGRR